MEYSALVACLLLLGLWQSAEGRVLAGPGHHALTSWRFDGDAVRRRCIESTVSNVTCTGVGEDRLLPHPDDCELFYYCVARVPICRQCPAGLHFNPIIHVCDRPEDAGCAPPPNTTTVSSSPSTSTRTTSEVTSTTFITSPSTVPTNNTSSYPTTLPSSTSPNNASSTTPREVISTTSAPSESTPRDSMTTYIILH